MAIDRRAGKPDPMGMSYLGRLAVVGAALAAAETEQRFADAQALRLAQRVLRELIDEERRLLIARH